MKPLSIIILGPAHPLRGGIAAFNERMALALQEAGHQVQIESFSLQYPSILFPGKTQYTTDSKPLNLSVKSTINSINPINWFNVGYRIKKAKPDLVISSFWMPFTGISLGKIQSIIRKNNHTQILGLIHNIIPHEPKPGDQLLASYYVKHTDRFISLSDSVAEDLKSFTLDKSICVLKHPIYDNYGPIVDRKTALNRLALSPDFRYALFFGLIRDYKGLDLLIDAAARDQLKDQKLKFLIVGEFYGDPKPYYDQIEKLGLQDRFIICPKYIPQEDIKFYFGAADVLIQPYKTATQSGISQLAYHFEVPMIVTNIGGLPEIVQHGKSGLICEPNADALASSIHSFFAEDLGDSFIESLRIAKKDFSWEIFSEKLMSQVN